MRTYKEHSILTSKEQEAMTLSIDMQKKGNILY